MPESYKLSRAPCTTSEQVRIGLDVVGGVGDVFLVCVLFSFDGNRRYLFGCLIAVVESIMPPMSDREFGSSSRKSSYCGQQ